MKKVIIEKAPKAKKKVVIEALPKAKGGLFVLGKDQKSGSIVGTDSSGNMTYMNPNAATPMQTFAANTKPEYQDPYFSENEPKQKTTPRFRFTGVDLAPISGNPYLQKGMNYLSRGINKIPGVMEYSKTGKISEDNLAPFYSGSMYSPFISEPETINKEVTPYYDERGKLRYKAEGGYNLPIAQNSMNPQLVGQEDDFDFSTQGLARPNLTVASNQYIADQNQEMSLNRPNLQGDLNQQLSASKKLDVPKLPGETARKAKRGFNQYTKGLVQASPAIDALAAGYQFGKGALDMMGSQMQNKAAQAREADMYTQAVFSDAMNVTPYETQGYGFSGRNALAADGMQIKQIGGMGEPNVEVEGREHIKLPNGFSQEIQGKSHAEGGIPLNLPQGTQIFSEKLKDPQTKKSYADLAKKFETKKYVDLLNSKSADPIQKTTAEMMIKQNNQKLEELFALQEENKLSGAHGAKVQQKAMQEQQQAMAQQQAEMQSQMQGEEMQEQPMEEPMMMHGGYHLPMYQGGGNQNRPGYFNPEGILNFGEDLNSNVIQNFRKAYRSPEFKESVSKLNPFNSSGVIDYAGNLLNTPLSVVNAGLTGKYGSTGNLATDIALDPLTYLGVNELKWLGKGAIKAGKGIGQAAQYLGKEAAELAGKYGPEIAKIAKKGKEKAVKFTKEKVVPAAVAVAKSPTAQNVLRSTVTRGLTGYQQEKERDKEIKKIIDENKALKDKSASKVQNSQEQKVHPYYKIVNGQKVPITKEQYDRLNVGAKTIKKSQPSSDFGDYNGIPITESNEVFKKYGGSLPTYGNAGKTGKKEPKAELDRLGNLKITYADGTTKVIKNYVSRKPAPQYINPFAVAPQSISQYSPTIQRTAVAPATPPQYINPFATAPLSIDQYVQQAPVTNRPSRSTPPAPQQFTPVQMGDDWSNWTGETFKTREGIITPTNVDLNIDPKATWSQYAKKYGPLDERITKKQTREAIAALQENIYDDYLDTERGREALNKMWQEFGVTNQMEEKYGDIAKKIKNKEKLSLDDLNRLRANYIDSLAGKRLPEYLEPRIYTPNIKGPTSSAPEEITPPAPGKETITKYVRPEIGLDMAMGIPLPEVYGRDPLNYYKIEPTYIDPRYLDIQPQLNEIARGQRALQSNIGSRGSADMANLLQAQANAAAAQQQAFGQKYNYDRAQDAAAQQFNAQAKAQADQYNQQSWFQQLEDPIRRRESIMDTQRRTDAQQELENMRRMQAYQQNKDIAESFYPYMKGLTGDQIVATLPYINKYLQDQGYETKSKKKKKSKEETTTAAASQNPLDPGISFGKYGGKVKIKPKLKGKFKK